MGRPMGGLEREFQSLAGGVKENPVSKGRSHSPLFKTCIKRDGGGENSGVYGEALGSREDSFGFVMRKT